MTRCRSKHNVLDLMWKIKGTDQGARSRGQVIDLFQEGIKDLSLWSWSIRYIKRTVPLIQWSEQPNLSENPTSTRQVPDKLYADNIVKLVQLVGEQKLSVKEMMSAIHHPRQKYLLTVKGLALYKNVAE